MPSDKEYNQRAAFNIRNKLGIELTPDQVVEERRKAIAIVRSNFKLLGFNVPDDDDEFIDYMRALKRKMEE
jgi:hypothetical protein